MYQYLLIIGIVLIGGIAITPGMADSIISSIAGTPVDCAVAPYNPDCSCEGDTNRIEMGWIGNVGTKYYCQPNNLVIGPLQDRAIPECYATYVK